MADGTEVGTAYVSIVPSAAGFAAKLQAQTTGAAALAGRRAGEALSGGITGQAAKIDKSLAGIFAAAGAGFAAVKVKDFVAGSVQAASALTEQANKAGVVFGAQAGQIERFAKNSADAVGLSQRAALEATGTFGNLFRAIGLGTGPAAQMSTRLVTLASDLASFNDVDPSVALDALRSGLVGETEPLRNFGVNMNDATLKTQALSLGLIASTKDAMTPAVKAQAAYALILAQTTTAQGDFARTSDSLANRQRQLAANIENFKATLGEALLPAVTATTGGLNNMLTIFTALPAPVQTVSVALAGLGAASVAVGLLSPKLAEARAALEGMGRAGTLASRSIGLIGKIGVGFVAAGAVVEASDAIGKAITRIAAGPVAPVNALTKGLVELGTTGKTTGELARQLGDDLGQLGEKASEAATPGWLATIARWNPSLQDSKRDIDGIDKALAGLVSSGRADVAARALDLLTKSIVNGPGGQGAADKFVGGLNDYKEALNGVDVQALLTGQSVDTAGGAVDASGDKAKEAAEKWDELRGGLEDLIASDWSQKLASNLEQALNPLERFTTNTGKSVADFRQTVQGAGDDLAKAKEHLDELEAASSGIDELSRDKTKVTAAELDAARHAVDTAAAALTTAQTELIEAQKSPLTRLKENLTANLKVITDWQANLEKLAGRGEVGEQLAKHLGALGPTAADAVAEATRQTDGELGRLEGLFDKADTRITDAASGAFELNLAQIGRPGETLAEIIAKRYEETLTPKLSQATLAALNAATTTILEAEALAKANEELADRAGPQTGTIPGAVLGPTRPPTTGPVLAPAPAPAPLINVPGFTYDPGGANKVVNVTINGSVPEPALLGKAIAWEL